MEANDIVCGFGGEKDKNMSKYNTKGHKSYFTQ